MNDRIFEINNTLLELAEKTKNQGVLSYAEIYNYLSYDKTENITVEQNKECKLWNRLIGKLSTPKETTTFHNYLPGWLVIRSKEFSSTLKSFKLYINLPEEEIEKYSLKIFKYLDKKKIKHVSKISDSIRTDGLVIRLSSIDETKDVVNYINKKCNKVARKTNPFMHRIMNVGIGCDFESSYNSFISSIISSYLKERYNTGNLNIVSYGDFKTYSENLFKNYFVNKLNTNELMNSMFFQDEFRRLSNSDLRYTGQDLILTIECMFKIFLSSLNNDIDINEILDKILNVQEEYFTKKYNNEPNITLKDSVQNTEQNKENILIDLLDGYIKYAIEKYGFVQAKNQLDAFMNNQSEECYLYITSDNNFRQRFIDANMKDNITHIILNLEEYFDKFNNIDYTLLTEILENYILSVGKTVAINSLVSLEQTKDYNYIEEAFRNKFNNYKIDKYLNFLTGNNIEEYVVNLYDSLKDNKHIK